MCPYIIHNYILSYAYAFYFVVEFSSHIIMGELFYDSNMQIIFLVRFCINSSELDKRDSFASQTRFLWLNVTIS